MMDQELDSFSKALELYLEELDRKFQRLREIASDPMFLNKSHPDYRSAFEKFSGVLDNIFEVKGVWYEARELEEKK